MEVGTAMNTFVRAGALVVVSLCACGARTDLGGHAATGDASVVAPTCTALDYGSDLVSSTLGITNSFLYFETWDGIHRIAKSGVERELVTPTAPSVFVVDESYVFWIDDTGEVMRAPVGGGSTGDAFACAVMSGCPGGAITIPTLATLNDNVIIFLAYPDFRPFSMPKIGGTLTALFEEKGGPTAAPRYSAIDDASYAWATDEYVFDVPLAPESTVATLAPNGYGGVAKSTASPIGR